jgi:hypothetical protein
MRIVAEVFVVWIGASFMLGPIIAWAFFYPERRAKTIQAARLYWIATHPKMSLQMMPTWLRWEDTSDTEIGETKALDLPRAITRRY